MRQRRWTADEKLAIIMEGKMRKYNALKIVLFVAIFSFLMMNNASALTNISNCTELQNIQNNLSEDYVLINNIDCSGVNFVSIGNDTNAFTGDLDGQNYNIINLSQSDGKGIFYNVSNSEIKNLNIVNMLIENVTSGGIGLLSANVYNSNILNCSAVGIIYVPTANPPYPYCCGGLGSLISSSSYSNISNCHTDIYFTSIGMGMITGGGLISSSSYDTIINSSSLGGIVGVAGYTGGLIGAANNDIILNSYSKVNIQTTGAGGHNKGGLIGYALNSNISNSYATGNVNCWGWENGGLIGTAENSNIINSYSTGIVGYYCYQQADFGGLIGVGGTCFNSYWDVNTSCKDHSACGEGKTTIEMKNPCTYLLAGWDMGTGKTWGITEGVTYPCLFFEEGCIYSIVCGDANNDDKVTVSDVVYLINYLFIEGPLPCPLEAGDTNCDGTINAADVVYLINYLFIKGPPPGCLKTGDR